MREVLVHREERVRAAIKAVVDVLDGESPVAIAIGESGTIGDRSDVVVAVTCGTILVQVHVDHVATGGHEPPYARSWGNERDELRPFFAIHAGACEAAADVHGVHFSIVYANA